MRLLRLHQVHRWDGGDRTCPRGECFESEELAEQVCGLGGSVHPLVLRVFESVDDFKANTAQEIRKRALAKLTPEEIDALGVEL